MHISPTAIGIFALSLVQVTLADFHLVYSDQFNYLPGGNGDRNAFNAYLPSNDYTCNWMQTAGHGHGTEVTPSNSDGAWPSTFTSNVAICGEVGLKFESNSNSGYDLIQTNGENVGSCYRNFGGAGLNCGRIGISWRVFENYVCYSYLCK